jgi:serine phosphatase RsbU (regulator of sigma subunit)
LERSGRFVTLFHCQLQGATRQFTYANAGHRLGFVLRAGGALETFEAQALPLGIFPEDIYTEKSVTLAPGDWIVIYSDGLIDARGNEETAVDELAAALAPERHATVGIERLVEVAVPPGELPDDLTVIVVRCQEERG